MKTKTLLTYILTVLYSLNIQAQLKLDSLGNIGIGTTAPSAKLDVQGSVYLPIGDNGNSYWIGATSDAGNRLRLHHNGQNAYIDFYPNLYFRANSTNYCFNITSGGQLVLVIQQQVQVPR